MKAQFTQSYLASVKPKEKAYWITDTGFRNLRLYITALGKKSFFVCYQDKDGKNRSHKLGSADAFTVTEARNMAGAFLTALARGEAPVKKKEKKLQLGEFIEEHYGPWVEVNRKAGKDTMATLRSRFGFLFGKNIDEITVQEIEDWRTSCQKGGKKASSINRHMTALKAALNWGVDFKFITTNPLSGLKRLKERDSNKKTRYLNEDERTRLLAALNERESRLRIGRDNHNKWLSERGKEPLPPLGHFADYLKPLVILALNTGGRKSDILGLKWGDVDFTTKHISFDPGKTDSSTTRELHVSMNKTVTDTLTLWREQATDTSPGALIFPSAKKKGAQIVSVKRAWGTLLKAAQIENFRWHDLRHDFASQLVSKGTDLNTVRDLLGHSDIKMTLRYAHLAPENKLKAVELLDAEE